MKKYPSAVIETIEHQIAFENPSFVKEMYDELCNKGYQKTIAKQILATVLEKYIYDILNNNLVYTEDEYQKRIFDLKEYEEKNDD